MLRSYSELVSVLLQLGDPPQQLFNYLEDLYLEGGFSIEPAYAMQYCEPSGHGLL